MVAESPVHFECRYYQTLRLPGNGTLGNVEVVIGRVISVHISDDVLTSEGRVDILKIRPIAKMGYYDYTSVDSLFEMVIPSKNDLLKAGMESRASSR
jgi:flavin reductase (DIM6/NTAB) family NADH-FMN oxidoreductase RutF